MLSTFYKMNRNSIKSIMMKNPYSKENYFGASFSRLFSNKIIGIDLGTTNSSVAILEGKTPKIIENSEGQRTTPSVVAFTNKGEKLVGLAARRQAVANPKNTFYATKRLIGRPFDDENTQKDLKISPFEIIRAPNGDAWVKDSKGNTYSPSQVGAFILEKMKSTADSYLGEKITKAVITVPAYFNDAQRQATKDAGKIASLTVDRVINEPTAAAIAYGMDRVDGTKSIAVYDLGGGTFDISILNFDDGVFEVKSTNGNTFLGGEDIDLALVRKIADDFRKKNGVDLMKDSMALQRLKEAAETAKIELSSSLSTEVNLPFISVDTSSGTSLHLVKTITRGALESLVRPFLEKTKDPCLKCLDDSGLNKSEINEVLLVGGMTRMPCVQSFVKEIFGREPCKGVNPDEAVALGAAVQAGVLMGKIDNLVLLDVTPLTLGIETLGGVSTPIIDRNTTIPTKKEKVFSTAADNQSQVQIKVLQGERPSANDNKALGEFTLDGIPPAPRGVPQIAVTFDIDASGIVHVTARDKTTGKEHQITVKSDGGLTDEEIKRMQQDAEVYKEKDRLLRNLTEIKNEADTQIYIAEKSLSDYKDKIPTDISSEIEGHLINLKSIISKKDITASEIKRVLSDLKKSISKIGPAMAQAKTHKEKEENKKSEGKSGKESSKEEVADAEFEDLNKK